MYYHQILHMRYQEETGRMEQHMTMYDDNISSSNTTTSGGSNLYDSSFYFMTSDYRVYKVLDNNDGAGMLWWRNPHLTSTSPFALGGYVLKYMYQVTTSEKVS